MQQYRGALNRYSREQKPEQLLYIEHLEQELRSQYFDALAMHMVDFDAVIVQCRKEAGI